MFLKKRQTALNKVLDSYKTLFIGWDKKVNKDDCIDEVVFEKGSIKITFQEDLREHIVNLYVLHPQYKIGKVYYREIFVAENLMGIDSLKQSIKELNDINSVEEKEIGIYIDFLKANDIL